MVAPNPNSIAYDPNQRIGDILARIREGREVILTQNGQVIARVLSSPGVRDKEAIQKSIGEWRELRKHMRLDGLKVKDLINEGRP